MPDARTYLLLIRVLAGGVFIAFGAGKFLNHAAELASFQSYGVPHPEALVVAIGLLELVGGALLIAGILVRPAALLLAADMVGAILLSGIAKGELVSLTLAPALLAATVTLSLAGLRGSQASERLGLLASAISERLGLR
jgi:uncharacterized membrane protein YphA (DoxX/SURF4 family)